MGTKRALASEVVSLCQEAKEGAFLDLFSGMCAVGTSLGETRPIWSNDLQVFAAAVAETNFCAIDAPLEGMTAFDLLRKDFSKNEILLLKRFGSEAEKEDAALEALDVPVLQFMFERRIENARALVKRGKYDLFADRFSAAYFSVRQCIEIDSLIFSIDESKAISASQKKWLKVALAVSISRCTTSTGHFAQPLMPNAKNVHKIRSQRRRKIVHEFIIALTHFCMRGSKKWRNKNKVFRQEANDLLDYLKSRKMKPSVIYADPPYTKDQYSRYYHVYETLMLYDYPVCVGRGLYREGRSFSDFCYTSKVEGALESLIQKCSRLKADLILSYPTNGLLEDSGRKISNMMEAAYQQKPKLIELSHHHSTLGASKGAAKQSVTEVLYMVRA